MKTAQDIIQEALEWRANEDAYDRERSTTLGKLLSNPLHGWRKKDKIGGESSIILYLTDRLRNEMNAREIAERKEESAYRKARKCVEIYGIEAERKLEEMWSKEK